MAPVLDKGFEDGAVHVSIHSNAADRHGTGAEARGQLRGGPPSSVLISGTTVLDKRLEDEAAHVAIHRRWHSVMPRINTERVRKLADGSVVVRLHPC